MLNQDVCVCVSHCMMRRGLSIIFVNIQFLPPSIRESEHCELMRTLRYTPKIYLDCTPFKYYIYVCMTSDYGMIKPKKDEKKGTNVSFTRFSSTSNHIISTPPTNTHTIRCFREVNNKNSLTYAVKVYKYAQKHESYM